MANIPTRTTVHIGTLYMKKMCYTGKVTAAQESPPIFFYWHVLYETLYRLKKSSRMRVRY